MIKRPPSPQQLPPSPYKDLIAGYQGLGQSPYMRYLLNPVDDQGRYLAYDEFRHRVPDGLDVNGAWALLKMGRGARALNWSAALPSLPKAHWVPIASIQKCQSLVDQQTTTAALEWTLNQLGETEHLQYLFNDLIEDEAISSSQLEGAATTTLAAKEMLKRGREPRTLDERMILGNLRMMRFAWEARSQPMTLAMLLELHKTGVQGIDDERYLPGVFRARDDVVVEDRDGNILHQPPPAKGLQQRLQGFCDWVNRSHDDMDSSDYMHPLIKAIQIHFVIGYEHPFCDGNGRVARALFYWFMFSKNYGAFRYISISNLLKKAVVPYGKSYLYTETDDMDMTYFIDHQCAVICRAVTDFKHHCEKSIAEVQQFNQWLWRTGILRELNSRQQNIFHAAMGRVQSEFTANQVKEILACSYNTAANDLNALVKLHLFGKKKDGREWVYYPLTQDEIKQHWKIGAS